MIRYTQKMEQDFLKPAWVKKLQEAGVELIDAKYFIYKNDGTYYLTNDRLSDKLNPNFEFICPTYTLPELLYKLNEWPGKEVTLTKNVYAGKTGTLQGISFFKDAPFYGFGYDVRIDGKNVGMPDDWLCYDDYPIIAAAMLLLKCIKNDIEYVKDISDK